MKKYRVSFASLAAVTAVTFVTGCGSPVQPAAKPAPQATQQTAEHKDDHKHAGHGAGPHEGTLADWGGGKYHVEFTVDHPKQEATVYILGSDEKTPTPVKADKLLLSINDPKFQLDLMPVPLDGEMGGLASRFMGKHESLGKVQEFAGTISGEVNGTPYAGDFKEEPHGAHEHK